MDLLKNMKSNLKNYNDKINRLEGVLKSQKKNRKEQRIQIKTLTEEFEDFVQAVKITQEVASKTQSELEFQLSSIVTSAIQAIFKKNYEFKIDFVMKRNKTEANIYLVDADGNKFSPRHDNGGGIVDVISFALRMACWRLNSPRTAPIMILDEPLKFVSEEYKCAVTAFIKELCDKLKMQVIMVTHEESFIENADNVIEVR